MTPGQFDDLGQVAALFERISAVGGVNSSELWA